MRVKDIRVLRQYKNIPINKNIKLPIKSILNIISNFLKVRVKPNIILTNNEAK